MFRIDADWALPDEAQPGDTFRVQLPKNVVPMESSFDVSDPQGEVIATATAGSGGVDFTLTSYVSDHANVFGTVRFWVEFTKDTRPGSEASIGWGEGHSTAVEVMPRTDEGWTNDRNRGQSHGEYYPRTHIVEWIVMGPLGYESVTFENKAKDGQEFVCGQMRAEIWNLDVGGHWESSFLAQDHDVTCSADRVEGTIRSVPAGKIGALIIPTRVPDGVTQVENTSRIEVDGRVDQPTAETVVAASGGSGRGEVVETTPDPRETRSGEGTVEWDSQPQADRARPLHLQALPLGLLAVGLVAMTGVLFAAFRMRKRR